MRPEIENYQDIKPGHPFKFLYGYKEYDCFVAAIDDKVGLTCEALDQEEVEKAGWTADTKTGKFNAICLPKTEFLNCKNEEWYNRKFNMYIAAIRTGHVGADALNFGVGMMASCAFA